MHRALVIEVSTKKKPSTKARRGFEFIIEPDIEWSTNASLLSFYIISECLKYAVGVFLC
jgi:hypothetical protein